LSLLKKHSRPAPSEARPTPALARGTLRVLLPLAAAAALSGDVGAVRPAGAPREAWSGRPSMCLTAASCAPTGTSTGARRPGTLPLRSVSHSAPRQVACAAGGLSRTLPCTLSATLAWRRSPPERHRNPFTSEPGATRQTLPTRQRTDGTRPSLLAPMVRQRSNGCPAAAGHICRCGQTNDTGRRPVNVLWGE
jgi:hypothetical protein